MKEVRVRGHIRRRERKLDFSSPGTERALMSAIDEFAGRPKWVPKWGTDPITGRMVRRWDDRDMAVIEQSVMGRLWARWEYQEYFPAGYSSVVSSGVADSVEEAKEAAESARRVQVFHRKLRPVRDEKISEIPISYQTRG